MCQERRDLHNEIGNLRRDLQLNGYPQGFNDSVIRFKGSSRPKKEENIWALCTSHMLGRYRELQMYRELF
jgi:hypothetical protein